MQLTQKVLLNSFYGVLGLKTFRFHDLDNAGAITSTGQSVIKFSAKVINASLCK
jgi:DNA polymerase, archaea type